MKTAILLSAVLVGLPLALVGNRVADLRAEFRGHASVSPEAQYALGQMAYRSCPFTRAPRPYVIDPLLGNFSRLLMDELAKQVQDDLTPVDRIRFCVSAFNNY